MQFGIVNLFRVFQYIDPVLRVLPLFRQPDCATVANLELSIMMR